MMIWVVFLHKDSTLLFFFGVQNTLRKAYPCRTLRHFKEEGFNKSFDRNLNNFLPPSLRFLTLQFFLKMVQVHFIQGTPTTFNAIFFKDFNNHFKSHLN